MNDKLGILLINIGTPEAPTTEALSDFLAEFLSDPYVVDYPRWLWKPVLEKIILRTRPEKSARLYAKIWEDTGSPLLTNMRSIAEKLGEVLPEASIALGMRYGKPSIADGLAQLKDGGTNDLVVFPLFPQFSYTTSQTAIDFVKKQIQADHKFPKITVVRDYHDHPAYIHAVSECIQGIWALYGKPEKMLFSYHGIPKRYITRKGEFYQSQCQTTTQLITDQLGLSPSDVLMSYQSKFGPEPWLTPYTEDYLTSFGEQKCESLHVVCPGFAVDCLETLEEIAVQGKAAYTQAGGSDFLYIPALNDTNGHIEALAKIISDAIVRGFKKGEK